MPKEPVSWLCCITSWHLVFSPTCALCSSLTYTFLTHTFGWQNLPRATEHHDTILVSAWGSYQVKIRNSASMRWVCLNYQLSTDTLPTMPYQSHEIVTVVTTSQHISQFLREAVDRAMGRLDQLASASIMVQCTHHIYVVPTDNCKHCASFSNYPPDFVPIIFSADLNIARLFHASCLHQHWLQWFRGYGALLKRTESSVSWLIISTKSQGNSWPLKPYFSVMKCKKELYTQIQVYLKNLRWLRSKFLCHGNFHSPSMALGHPWINLFTSLCNRHTSTKYCCLISNHKKQQQVAHSRGFLDDFLMPPLYTAVSFKKVDIVAMLVSKHLHLHMPVQKQCRCS